MIEQVRPGSPKRKARLIAFYLPQFHPVSENDEWWGKGFTEWTNVAKAKPLFPGHYQPHVPADLGFYDLRVPETRQAQADMAREYGIEGFCYWHYWFAGRRLLERPFQEVLESGKPDFPFCLGWANHSWTGVWLGAPGRILVEQTYPGMQDHEAHFRFLMRAFTDPRYMTVDGKPIFLVFAPTDLPDALRVTDFWRELASREGLPGLHLIAHTADSEYDPRQYGFDAVTIPRFTKLLGTRRKNPVSGAVRRLRAKPPTASLLNKVYPRPAHVYTYREAMPHLVVHDELGWEYYPCVTPNWDNTPRSGMRGSVLHGATPELFRTHLRDALQSVSDLPDEHCILIVKSWNEWAEGNHLEPDLRYGKAFLEVIQEEVLVPPSSPQSLIEKKADPVLGGAKT